MSSGFKSKLAIDFRIRLTKPIFLVDKPEDNCHLAHT